MVAGKDLDRMVGHCHCGKVHISPSAKPEFLNDCNCTMCASSGAIWGYFNVDQVHITGDTGVYYRADYAKPAVDIHFCKICGNCTHWLPKLPEIANRMGLNMRLFPASDLEGVELRFPDGRNWFGETDYGYRKSAVILHRENHVGLW